MAGVHIGLYFRKVPTVNPSVTPPACQLPFAREPLRAVPADNFPRESPANRYCPSSARYRRLVRRTYSLFTLHYSLKTPGIGGLPKPPGPLRGCLGLPRRGDSVAKATELLTYSRFLIPSISLAPLEKGAFFVCGFFENFVNLKKNNHQKKGWGSSQKHTQNHTIWKKTDLPPLPILGVKMGN